MAKQKLISIITPVFNEEKLINNYYSRVSKIINKLSDDYNFEIIINDNCSTDATYSQVEKLALKDNRIKLFKFSKNFGYQKSIWFGYHNASGDAAIELDVDLQDPPEMIEQMIGLWSKGYMIVYGIRKKRKEGLFINILRKVFYRLIRITSESDIPNDAGDFIFIDKRIIDELKKLNPFDPYVRGIIFSLGYSRVGIEYIRDARKEGQSKFGYLSLINFATNAFVSSSTLPLRLASYIGLFAILLSIFFGIFFIIDKIFFNTNIERGLTSILVLVLISIALNSLFIGILGEYIAKIYRQLSSVNSLPIVEKSLTTKTLKKKLRKV